MYVRRLMSVTISCPNDCLCQCCLLGQHNSNIELAASIWELALLC